MYVKDWKHTELNTKLKISIENFEELKSEETIVSSECDQVYDLIREDNISVSFK